MWEQELLLWIHSFSSPSLDRFFWVTHLLGTAPFFTLLVVGSVSWHLARRQRGEAGAWILVGVSVYILLRVLKAMIARPRPVLWVPLVAHSGYSFPSGHALGTAAFFPLFAYTLFQTHRGRRRAAFACAVVLVLGVGVGRLYLGVHWPSDVLAGWAIGFAHAATAIGFLRRRRGGDGPPATTYEAFAVKWTER